MNRNYYSDDDPLRHLPFPVKFKRKRRGWALLPGHQYMEFEPSSPSLAGARCAEVDSELFFSEDRSDVKAAKSICAQCPLVTECLAIAMTRTVGGYYPYGIWGGTTNYERSRMRHIQRQLEEQVSA